MALIPQELFGPITRQGSGLRAFPYEDGIMPGKLASYAADREVFHLSALSYDETLNVWELVENSANEVNTISSNAVPATAGTFTLTVDGQTTTPIAFNATAATIQAALEALSNVVPTDVVAVATSGANLGVASAVVTLTWGNDYAAEPVNITADMSGLSGNPHVFATSPEGGSVDNDTDPIDGFLWDPCCGPHLALAAGETLVQVFRNGVIHIDDIPTPGGMTRTAFEALLESSLLREKGINLQGLPGFH